MRTRKELRPYQNRGIEFLLRRRYGALLIDMGLGKTIMILSAIIDLLKAGKVENVLLVAPIRVIYGVWRQEAREWEHTRWLKFSIVHGSVKERLAALEKPAHVHMINPEGLVWLKEYYKGKEIPFDMLVVDESSMFKKPRVKRFMAIRSMLRFFKRRVIATGTPTPNSLLELWPQMFLTDMGYSLGTRFGDYKTNYFRSSGYMGYGYEPLPGAQQAITDAIGPRVVALNSEDYIKLPEFIDDPIWIDLPPDARELYDQLEKEMFLEFEEGELDVANAAGLTNRCSQIANGAVWLKDDFGNRIWRPIHDAKLDALNELVQELQGEPPLIVYQWAHDLERIRAHYPKYAVLGKGTKAKETTLIERKWNTGRLPGLIVHPRSAGHGLNLQKGGHHLIWYGVTWSLEAYQQVCKRLHRSGQVNNVINHLILAANTTDVAVMAALRFKSEGQDAVKAALSAYYNQRKRGAARRLPVPSEGIANLFQNHRNRV